MVPVMVLWRSENIFQKAEIDTCIGMDQYRMDGHENNIRIKRDLGETEYVQGDKRHRACYKNIDKMGARTCQPIHMHRGMMHRMKAPEIRMGMEKAMRPILEEVSNQERK